RREVRLRVGTRFELGMSWLLPAVMALEKARPNWQIDLYCGASADILERLNGGQLDAIVTSSPIAAATHVAQVLHPESYELVASRRLAARVPVKEIADCKAHTLLDLDEGLPLARYLTSAAPGIEFAGVRFCGSTGIVFARVRAGDGVAVLPSYMVERELKERRLLRLLPKVALFSDSFRLISRKGASASEPLAVLAEYLRGRKLR
ncbi:MAG TPA: substrate-binding domain-containing protein, partial [Polyangiaceae bacterium]